jgi:hypothetical protein
MPDRGPGDLRKADVGKTKPRRDAAVKMVGEHLRCRFDKVLTEPMPTKIMDLMAKLDRKLL